MASTKNEIQFLYSRELNGLAEKQRWWPAHITDKSNIGLTVDPVLFNTNFGPNTIEDEGRGKTTEANTAGVRVECLNMDGTAPSGTPTIQIIDSGTLNARCVLTHPDGTKTEWRFVAPSSDSQTSNGYGNQSSSGAGSMNPSNASPLPVEPAIKMSAGPYPVFATLQDFIDWLDGLSNSWSKLSYDTYYANPNAYGANGGQLAQEVMKSAWLPHGLIGDSGYGGSTGASSAWPAAQSDPRISTSNNDALPTTGLYIATMFMPLLYDNNQLSYTSANANNDIVKGIYSALRTVEDGTGSTNTYYNFYDDGMTRYSQQPQELTAGGLPQVDSIDGGQYKWFKNSGDFLDGRIGSFQKVDTEFNPDNVFDYINWDIDPSSSAYGGPSYRMRTALACFLKDGTYSLSGGTLIPYVYDPARTVGGADGTTVYAVWNGKAGKANTPTQLSNPTTDLSQSAQIFPLYDFLQGPISPAGQGWNYDWDQISLNYTNWMNYTQYANEQYDAYANGQTGDTNTAGATGTSPTKLIEPAVATRRQQARSGLVRPNPTRAPLYAVAQGGAGTATTITTSGNCAGLIEIWVEDNNASASKENYWREGMPVNFQVDGVLGGLTIGGVEQFKTQKGPNAINTWVKGASSSIRNIQFGTATFVDANTGTTKGANNRSGWYICNKVEALTAVNKSTIVSGATGTFTGHKLTFIINTGYDFSTLTSTDYGAMEDVAAYQVVNGWACQGILGGSEYAWGNLNVYDPTVSPATETTTKRTTNGTHPYNPVSGFYVGMGTRRGQDLAGKNYPPNKYSIGYYGNSHPYDFNGGLGFYGGFGQASQNVPSFGGLNFTAPTRLTLDPLAYWYATYGGWWGDDSNTPAGIALQDEDTSVFISNPIASGHGGGMLRLNAPSSFGHAGMYFSQTDMTQVVNGGLVLTGDFVGSNNNALGAAVDQMTALTLGDISMENGTAISQRTASAGWYSKSISVLFQSFYEQSSGKNAWDYMGVGGGVLKYPYGRNRIWPVHERVATKQGYGPLQFAGLGWGANTDKVHTANHPTVGMETIKMGLTEVGCSPIWLDLQMKAWWPVRDGLMTTILFDGGIADLSMGRHSHNGLGGGESQRSQGFTQLRGEGATATNQEIEWSTWGSMLQEDDVAALVESFNPQVNVGGVGFSKMWSGEVWDYQGSPAGAWAGQAASNGWPYSAVGTNNVLWGNMGNWLGTGTPFALVEGYHTLRTVFDESGMTLLMDGQNKGKDLNANDPIWGFSILFQKAQGRAYKANLSPIKDAQGWAQWVSNPAFNKTSAALQVDEISIRHIPTDAMLPFPVDTVKQQIAGVGKYTGLSIEVDNIKESKNMNVKVSICPIGQNIGSDGIVMRQGEGGTPYSGFDKLSINAIGGFGSIDLTELPADAITNGFVIRFHFYVPSAADTSLHPVDWSSTPVVKSWTIEYDLAPTSAISCIGNTYNGDITAPIDTKVGHIISFRGTATTTDIDRTVKAMKFDFGDGTITDWLPFTNQTLQSNIYDTAHSYLTSGTFAAKAYTQDDAGNESAFSSISVVVVNAAPVAVLRAVPSLIRAGQPITLDASDSFDINAGASLASYTFTYGDGSGSTTNASGSAQHTYATAGEYQATLTVVDNDGATSQTAIAIVKVLPATLVVPLVFNTKPRAFQRMRTSEFGQTPVLDAVYPELTDTGQRMDEFTLSGSFLKSTANSDIEFCEELQMSGSLVEFMWEDIDFNGTPTGKTFVGRITAFDYSREGGAHGETPYNMTLVREAGLGV